MSRFKTSETSKALGLYVGFLPGLMNYTGITEFEGLAVPIAVHEGTAELNELLRSDTKDRIAVIDGRYMGSTAVVGREEVVSAVAGGCKALIVIGLITERAAVEMSRIAVLAAGHTPRAPSPTIGSAKRALIDIDGGKISAQHYIVADSDGVVAVEREIYQSKFAIK